MTIKTICKYIIIVSLIFGLTGCSSKNSIMIEDASDASEANQSNNDAEDTVNSIDNGNQTRSIFSWHFEMTNKALSETYLQTLKQLGINRVYQNISAKVMRDDEIVYLIQKLNSNGIEMIPLMGDKSWVEDGLDEYIGIIDEIDEYNESADEGMKINAVALDVEVHLLPDFKSHKKKLFKKYIEVMCEAKSYAHEKDLKVIQVIPTFYDDISDKLFETFINDCCDEISIMNYTKSTQESAISTEVEYCINSNIPVESVFETMRDSEQYEVDENISYYRDGTESLLKSADRLRDIYGNRLGIGFHQFTSVYSMVNGRTPAEIVCTPLSDERMANPGMLLLIGDDGAIFEASPYWHKGRKSEEGFRYLTNIDDADRTYTVYYSTLQDRVKLCDDAKFITEGNSIYVMNIE